MSIAFESIDIPFKLKNIGKIKRWIQLIIQKEKKSCGNLMFHFVNDEHLLSINQSFLKHKTLTDIITFDYCEGKVLRGEIFISIPRINENAQTFNVPFDEELRRVIIHGVLHLCGYKDKTKTESDKMRQKENSSLKLYLSKTV